MNLNIFHYFTPKDRKILPLFEKLSNNLVTIATALDNLLNASPESRKDFVDEIEKLENISDAIAKNTLHELSINFIIPFDREDVYNFIIEIANVAGFIYNTSKKLALYQIDVVTPEMKQLGKLVLSSAEEINTAVLDLKNLRSSKNLSPAILRINENESKADVIFEAGLLKIFAEEKDPVQLIKYKDVLSFLEVATDKCENVANVLENIMIKNA